MGKEAPGLPAGDVPNKAAATVWSLTVEIARIHYRGFIESLHYADHVMLTTQFNAKQRAGISRALIARISVCAALVCSLDQSVGTSLAQSGTRFAGTADGTFRLDKLKIPAEEILSGGVAKDGIPAISKPAMLAAKDARFLRPNDRVIGVVLSDEARAYPLKVLTQHEIVNDRVADVPIAVTYCPLCDSTALFDRRIGEETFEFGVSGLLYNSNVLMYDRTNRRGGLWSQMLAEGISGTTSGSSLKPLPVEVTTWGDWRRRHPQTLVLAPKPGSERRYERNPYRDYFATPELMFPTRPTSALLPAKVRVLGMWTDDGGARAYPLSALAKLDGPVVDWLQGKKLSISYNHEAHSARVEQADDGVHWVYSFWFAWFAFHPKTDVFATHSDKSRRN